MIEILRETGSTNADLLSRLAAGERVAEGHWVVADRQTHGRGRLGREWSDGAGNFMGSTVVHVGYGDPDPATLALVAGLAVHEAVRKYLPVDSPLLLKWPNDLYVGREKLAGILLERAADTVIVGIGVNLLHAPAIAGRDCCAVADFGSPPDRDAFAAELVRLFDIDLHRWRSYGLGPIVARWLANAHPVGTALTVKVADGELAGAFAGLSADGALQLRLAGGTARTIHAGEVNFTQG